MKAHELAALLALGALRASRAPMEQSTDANATDHLNLEVRNNLSDKTSVYCGVESSIRIGESENE